MVRLFGGCCADRPLRGGDNGAGGGARTRRSRRGRRGGSHAKSALGTLGQPASRWQSGGRDSTHGGFAHAACARSPRGRGDATPPVAHWSQASEDAAPGPRAAEAGPGSAGGPLGGSTSSARASASGCPQAEVAAARTSSALPGSRGTRRAGWSFGAGMENGDGAGLAHGREREYEQERALGSRPYEGLGGACGGSCSRATSDDRSRWGASSYAGRLGIAPPCRGLQRHGVCRYGFSCRFDHRGPAETCSSKVAKSACSKGKAFGEKHGGDAMLCVAGGGVGDNGGAPAPYEDGGDLGATIGGCAANSTPASSDTTEGDSENGTLARLEAAAHIPSPINGADGSYERARGGAKALMRDGDARPYDAGGAVGDNGGAPAPYDAGGAIGDNGGALARGRAGGQLVEGCAANSAEAASSCAADADSEGGAVARLEASPGGAKAPQRGGGGAEADSECGAAARLEPAAPTPSLNKGNLGYYERARTSSPVVRTKNKVAEPSRGGAKAPLNGGEARPYEAGGAVGENGGAPAPSEDGRAIGESAAKLARCNKDGQPEDGCAAITAATASSCAAKADCEGGLSARLGASLGGAKAPQHGGEATPYDAGGAVGDNGGAPAACEAGATRGKRKEAGQPDPPEELGAAQAATVGSSGAAADSDGELSPRRTAVAGPAKAKKPNKSQRKKAVAAKRAADDALQAECHAAMKASWLLRPRHGGEAEWAKLTVWRDQVTEQYDRTVDAYQGVRIAESEEVAARGLEELALSKSDLRRVLVGLQDALAERAMAT